MSTFIKVSALPAGDTTLVDLNGATTVYLRAKMTSAGRVVVEASYAGQVFSLVVNPTTAVSPGGWYWLSFIMGPEYNVYESHLMAQVTGPGGSSDGVQNVYQGSSSREDAVSCTLGWGVSRTSGYANFPFGTGSGLSKLVIDTSTSPPANLWASDFGVRGVPTADSQVTAAQGNTVVQAAYLCQAAVGSSTVTDSSGHGYDLSAGPQGMVIAADGPYA